MQKAVESNSHTKRFGQIHTQPYSFLVTQLVSSPKHWQAEIEGVYIESGWLDISVQDQTYHLKAGNFMFIPEGVIHSYLKKADDGVVHVLNFLQEHVIKHTFANDTKTAISRMYKNYFIAESLPAMGEIVHQIQEADFGDYNECYLCCKLTELTSYFLRYPSLIVMEKSRGNEDTSNSLRSTFDFIHEHIRDGITLEALANHLGFSVCYCSRYIKKKTGMTFVEYVNASRISEAETLLLETNDNITEIAYATGFSSVQTFNRVFKQIRNINPTEYRKKRKGKK